MAVRSLALFFATIVRAPIYTGVTFRGYAGLRHPDANGWMHFNGQADTPGRVVHPSGDANPELGRPSTGTADVLLRRLFGPIRRSVLLRYRRNQGVRGFLPDIAAAVRPLRRQSACARFRRAGLGLPRVIPSPSPGKRYGLKMRVVLQPLAASTDCAPPTTSTSAPEPPRSRAFRRTTALAAPLFRTARKTRQATR